MVVGRKRTNFGGRRLWALALASSLALGGCFELVQSTRMSRVCTPDAARKAGDHDARSSAPARESYAQICGVAEPSLNGIYTEAYNAVPEAERKPGFFRRLLH